MGKDEKKQQGYLRNMYVNYNQIRDSFVSPGSSIESGMMKLANSLNTRLDFWDFEVESKELNTSSLLTVSIIEKDNISDDNGELIEDEELNGSEKVFGKLNKLDETSALFSLNVNVT